MSNADHDATVGADGDTRESACLNCGTVLIGTHCHACGQPAHVHKTISAFFHDLLHGVFHFEGKIWRTLPALALRPGQLTREYVDGRRATYIGPLALFLFCVFLLFAVTGMVGSTVKVQPGNHGGPDEVAQVRKEVAERVMRLEKARAAAVSAGQPTTDLDRDLEEAKSDQRVIMMADAVINGESADAAPIGKLSPDTGHPALDHAIAHVAADPKLFFYKLQTKAYKFSWALIPLSLPFMWLLLIDRRPQYGLYDHAVFVTYSLCAVMLLLIAMALVTATGLSATWMLLLIPLHFYLQLRGAYHLGTGDALWRTAVLMVISGAVLLIAGLLLIVLGLMG